MTIALVAHDGKKDQICAWASDHWRILIRHELVSTANTGLRLEAALRERAGDQAIRPTITKVMSGPLGGDQQIGAMIVDGSIDLLVFMTDPLFAHPHDSDIQALLRLAALYDVPTAFNRASADLLISSLRFRRLQAV